MLSLYQVIDAFFLKKENVYLHWYYTQILQLKQHLNVTF